MPRVLTGSFALFFIVGCSSPTPPIYWSLTVTGRVRSAVDNLIITGQSINVELTDFTIGAGCTSTRAVVSTTSDGATGEFSFPQLSVVDGCELLLTTSSAAGASGNWQPTVVLFDAAPSDQGTVATIVADALAVTSASTATWPNALDQSGIYLFQYFRDPPRQGGVIGSEADLVAGVTVTGNWVPLDGCVYLADVSGNADASLAFTTAAGAALADPELLRLGYKPNRLPISGDGAEIRFERRGFFPPILSAGTIAVVRLHDCGASHDFDCH
jgi:hypothetical protein